MNADELRIGLLVLLMGSGLFNVWLFKQRIRLERQLNSLSLDPIKFNGFSQDEGFWEGDTIKVVFFGDSRASAWISPKLENFEFINRGINGETSAQSLLRFEDHVSCLCPDIIILQVGVNDLRMIPYPAQSRKVIIESCQINIQKIIQKSHSIGATIIVTTIFPIGQGNIPFNRRWIWPEADAISQGISEVNDFIRSLEGQDHVIVFDAYKILEHQGNVKSIYALDLLHINSQGYEQLNHELERILNQVN
ncbi:lipolytic protein G-D-S-L family [Gloeothece citriformis PCC 7424]|uniref:Lipolytic protein G-D-S-L family n=1 Tax=Gloeothece citriformis (strain PCC 7424) TaxID=65393 RepID=B7KGC6_GLOC7|nr:SGNH/GDSL hydrolase family protein [Gloeothece citriformis]ACK70597.1 lipolytic protein G-D-S-L family [Gloeothece citriformis PCC 7424]